MKQENNYFTHRFYCFFFNLFERPATCASRVLSHTMPKIITYTHHVVTTRYDTLHYIFLQLCALATVKLKFRHENIGVIYYTSYSHRDFSIQKTFLIKCYLLFFSVLWSLAILMLLLLPPFLFLPMFRWCLVHGLKKRLRKKIEEAKRIGNHNRAQAD